MDYLRYNIDHINDVARTYNNCVITFNDMMTSMNNMVSDLKKGWQSEAGEAFFQKYNDDWLVNFKQYQEVLLHMSENLTIAGGEYKSVSDRAKKVFDIRP